MESQDMRQKLNEQKKSRRDFLIESARSSKTKEIFMDRAIEEEIDFYKSNLDKLDDADAPIIEEEPLEGTKAQGFFYSWLG